MDVTMNKEAIKFSRVLWLSVLTLPGKHKKTFAYLEGSAGNIAVLLPALMQRVSICTPRYQWPHGGSVADSLLVLRARIPPGAWMFVSWNCCVL